MRFFLLLAIFACKGIFAQPINLVPNSGFEVYDSCPYFANNPILSGAEVICRAIPWFQPCYPNVIPSSGCGNSSSDFYHLCSGNIPIVWSGFDYQYPNSGGGFSGINLGGPPPPFEGREYIEVKLKNELTLNKKYCVLWHSNLSRVSKFGSNRAGAYFSKDTIFQFGNDFNRIPVIPQIENLAIVMDTQNWVPFHQIFKAEGGEKYMTVGNFRENSMIETQLLYPNNTWSYYYFDDFGVYELPEISAGLGGEIDTLGENIPLQASCEGCWNDLVYRWWPSAGLSDTTILNPIATPDVTTTYYFGLIDTSETVLCIVDLVDSVTVFVTIPQDTVTPPPTSFSWLVYPSPTSGNLTLQFSALTNDSQLLIIDARGRLVRKIFVPKNTESMPLDISALAGGEYFLQIENEGLKEKRKITKI